jgi:hypothetical protein
MGRLKVIPSWRFRGMFQQIYLHIDHFGFKNIDGKNGRFWLVLNEIEVG